MIVIYVSSLRDTLTFSALYEKQECTLLHNPNRADVIAELEKNPEETVLCFGHGSGHGLMNEDMSQFIIDSSMRDLLCNREIIGIWCYAADFARENGLKGFFTNMFISNPIEAMQHNCGFHKEEVVYEQNDKFARAITDLIKGGTPMEQWPESLYENSDKELSFVEYNYRRLEYIDGEDTPLSDVIQEERDALWNEVFGSGEFVNEGFVNDIQEKYIYFARRSDVDKYVKEKYDIDEIEDYEDLAVLSDEEFMELAVSQYCVEEFVTCFNEGTSYDPKEYCARWVFGEF